MSADTQKKHKNGNYQGFYIPLLLVFMEYVQMKIIEETYTCSEWLASVKFRKALF